jgi:glyoxylase-like metal-dependent hydrolase (beta-lactamase superfamily II)
MTAEVITRHTTSGGVRIYRIPVQVFPLLTAQVHVVVAGDYVALIDTGSGLGQSDPQLRAGFAALQSDWGERFTWSNLSRIVITHAHIDHYGGLRGVRELTKAPIAVHALDRRVLTNHTERLTVATYALTDYLRRAGVPAEQHAQLIQMYGWSKEVFSSVDVATVIEEGDRLDDLFQIYHVPGHCPGQVCLMIEDILLTADHVLPRTALFLAPESITHSTGVEHYLRSLKAISRVEGVRLALGGHEEPIDDFYACVERCEMLQHQRIERVREICREPRTISEITKAIYPGLMGYDGFLAIQKTGAYVEYLDDRGELAIANLAEVAADPNVAPRYHRL